MWKVNRIGIEQVWYSEQEYKQLEKKFNEQRELLLTCLKFINHLRENNLLDEIEIGNTDCRNCLDKIQLFWKLYKKYFKDENFLLYDKINKLKKESEEK